MTRKPKFLTSLLAGLAVVSFASSGRAVTTTLDAVAAQADSCFTSPYFGHVLFIPGLHPFIPTDGTGDGFKFVFTPNPGSFTENDVANTGSLTGHLESLQQPGYGFNVTLTLSGRTSSPGVGGPQKELSPSCYAPSGAVNTANWHYYTSASAQLLGTGLYQGAIINLTAVQGMGNFQVGDGAAGKNQLAGASGWFTWTIARNPDSGLALRDSATLSAITGRMIHGDFNFNILTPGLKLVKSVDKQNVSPGDSVTYSYVVTNTGGTTLTNVVVVDDNGTAANTGDDFTVGTISSLAPGASQTFTITKQLQPQSQSLCSLVDGNNTVVGTLSKTVLPSGDIQVTFTQGQNVNDNRYGTGATAATGWSGGHKFNDLVGSDQAVFSFTNGLGTEVLNFDVDYISQSATFPSGYGSLGVTGGEGNMNKGSAANVLSATTSLTENLKKPQFQSGFLVNSPTETPLNSGVSSPAGWDYNNSYTVVVSKNAFGASGFGSVTITSQHNSPGKIKPSTPPTPCDTPCIVNVAKATATSGNTTLTATSSAEVCFGTNRCNDLVDCTPPYPFQSANPLTNIPFNESEVLRDAALSFDANCKPVALQVFYNDEHALTLGVRQVNVKTAAGTATTNYTVTPLSTNPGSTTNPSVGSTATTGDQAGTDLSGRPLYPALYVTDLTANPGNPLAGDWQSGGTAILPSAVFGTWKAAVRTVDKTKTPNVVTVTPDADPAKNNYNLGAGADPVAAGLTNQGYGAEVRWDLSSLNLASGHEYRLYFMVHDGDQNKTGGDVGQECATFTMP